MPVSEYELILDQLQRLVPDWQSDEVNQVEFLEGGYSNNNFRLTYQQNDYVLRLPQIAQPFVDRQHESAWYTRLGQLANPRQQFVLPLALDPTTGAMLSPWVEGSLLVDCFDRQNLARSMEELGSYLQHLHSNLPDAQRNYDVAALTDSYGAVSRSVPFQPATTVTCHNDLNPWNIIVTAQGWVTLDWEFVGHNDPLFDLICLHQGLELSDESLADLIGLVQPDWLDDPLRIQGNLYNFWLREWSWADFQLQQGNQRAEIRNQAEVANRKLSKMSWRG